MDEEKRATIRDVARETGLAVSTVSNALAGKSLVKLETRERVLRVADKLGYRASIVAQSLRGQKSFAIGVLIEDVSNPSSSAFVRGVEDVASATNFTLLLANTDGQLDRQKASIQSLIDRQVDGLVLISQHVHDPVTQSLVTMGPPAVLLQRRDPALDVDYVGSDNRGGIREAVQYAYRIGHRRIGFITGPMTSSSAKERTEAYHEIARSLGLEDFENLIFQGHYTFESGLDAAAHFSRLSTLPTCILASNDMNAIALIQGLSERGIRVPEDVSVIGLDDIALADIQAINLTTIRLEKRDMGSAAANLLLQRINNPEVEIQTVIHPTRLVIRGTTAPPRSQ